MLKQKTALIILYTVMGLLVVALIAQIYLEGSFTSDIAVRTLIPMGLCASAIAKVTTGSGKRIRNTKLYEREYATHLRSAFSAPHRKHQKNQLMDAIGYYNRKQYEAALNKLKALLPQCESDDDFCAVYMFMGLTFADAGLIESAIDAYYAALRYDETRSTVWSNVGMLFDRQGRNGDALACFGNAIKHDDKNAYAYNNLAATYFSLGQYDYAMMYAQKALELKSNMYQASNMVCMCCAIMGDEDGCKKYYQISVTHGADPNGLQKAVERCRSGDLAVEGFVPFPEDVQKAVHAFFSSTALPFVHMGIPYDQSMGGKSRLGGHSIGEPPLDTSGNPMRLLCAVYCSEVTGVPDFPSTGLLRFFIADNDVYGVDFDHPTEQKNFRVLYTESEEELSDVEMPAPSEQFPVKGSFKTVFTPDIAAMTDTDYRFHDSLDTHLERFGSPTCDQMEDELFDSICLRYHSEGHRVGGYPYFTQEDPRDAQEELRRYDRLLLQVDTHDEKIEIGDGGVMNFFIPSEKLKARDFSDVLYWWDCH